MFVKRMVVLGCAALLVACSDTPVTAPSDKPQQYQFPQAALDPTSPFATPTVIPSGPHVEIYSNGILKQVLTGASGAGGAVPQPDGNAGLSGNYADLLDQLSRKPVNKRTAHFVELMRGVANAAPTGRGKVMEAVSRQLLKETEHKDYRRADGARVLEYYFDHQLAGRVVLASPAPAGKRQSTRTGHVATPASGETVSDPDATYCDTCEDPAYDAMLWASLMWYADQLQGMIDVEAYDSDMVVYEKMCLGPIGGWTLAVFGTGALIGSTAEGWGNLTRYEKLGRLAGVGAGFSTVIAAWNAMHECFHS